MLSYCGEQIVGIHRLLLLARFVSPKLGILWIMHGHRRRPHRFSCVQPTSDSSFWISFKHCKWLAMAELWPPYSFDSAGVKIML